MNLHSLFVDENRTGQPLEGNSHIVPAPSGGIELVKTD